MLRHSPDILGRSDQSIVCVVLGHTRWSEPSTSNGWLFKTRFEKEQLVRQRIDSGELVLPFGDFIETENQGYFLVHPPHEPMPRRLQVLIDWLRECAGTQ